MKQYIKNLISALMGNNPYQTECDTLQRQIEQAGENVRSLNELYYNMVERWEADKKQVASLQQLVENLRERIGDKDAEIAATKQDYRERMERMKQEYQKRLQDYMVELDAAKGELQLVEKKEIPF